MLKAQYAFSKRNIVRLYLNIEKENTTKSPVLSDIKLRKPQKQGKLADSINKISFMERIRNLLKGRKAWKEPSPEEVSVDNAYKTRWIWYHTILALELLMVNMLLVAILIVLALKL